MYFSKRNDQSFQIVNSGYLKENIMDVEFGKRFLENTDETGRFFVYSIRTGKTYAVEPIGFTRTEWGSVYPGEKELHHKKGDGKYRGSICEDESLITEEHCINIQMLPPGTSPHAAIEVVDATYPDRV